MGSSKMLRAGRCGGGASAFVPQLDSLLRAAIRPEDLPGSPHPDRIVRASICVAAAIAILLLLSACGQTPVVTAVETFCHRVERFHATDEERAFLKANSGPLERIIRWMAGINKQWDETCLKPVSGP